MELSYVYVQLNNRHKQEDAQASAAQFEDTGVNWTAKYIKKLQQHEKDDVEVNYSHAPGSAFSNFRVGRAANYAHPPTAPIGALKPNKGLNPVKSNRNIQPGFHYHTSSKEPVAAIKNIGSEVQESMKSTQRGIFNLQQRVQSMSGDRTTKAGTAIPSTRQGTSPYDQPPPQTAASMVMYKSMVKSSNFGSVIPSSTGSPLRHGTAGPYHIRKGSMALSNFPNPPGVTNS